MKFGFEWREAAILLPLTPSFHVYKAYTHIKIQTFLSLTNSLTINFLFYNINFIQLYSESNIVYSDYKFIIISDIIYNK